MTVQDALEHCVIDRFKTKVYTARDDHQIVYRDLSNSHLQNHQLSTTDHCYSCQFRGFSIIARLCSCW